jgi:hypothetical protein
MMASRFAKVTIYCRRRPFAAVTRLYDSPHFASGIILVALRRHDGVGGYIENLHGAGLQSLALYVVAAQRR